MAFSRTTAFNKILNIKKRIRAVQGGTAAGKTIAILLYLIDRAQSDIKPTITSVVSESFPHLRKGAIRDFLSILEQHNYFNPNKWSKSEFIYTFENGSQIEFFSADQPGKVRGPRRDRLFINEANNISYETFDQLEVRTRDMIFLDWNPVSEFWYYDKVANRSDVELVIVNYKDNEALDKSVVDSIEQRKNRSGWWKVYGEGMLGEVEGKIYKDWQIVDNIPHEARLERRGLDFGYTNDPTAIIDIYKYNEGFILDEVCYQKGLSNKQIADTISALAPTLVLADSSEPKSIDEIKNYGINILPAIKGPGSVNQGIQYIQGQRISVTKRSINLIKEYRNYMWRTDKDGKVLNIPEDVFNHCLDATRYGLSEFKSEDRETIARQATQFARNRNQLGLNSTR